MPAVTIDVFSDVVCPWCWIGERRLRRALAERPDLTVELNWRPFQLRPAQPAGVDWASFARDKFGGMERAAQMFATVTQTGAEEGLEFRFDQVASAPNTTDAHRLILFADAHERGWECAEALFRGYFTEGQDLNDTATLARIGASLGLDERTLRAFLDSDEARELVITSQETAEQLGVTGVPFYVFDAKLAVSGAQPPEVFLEAIRQAEEEAA